MLNISDQRPNLSRHQRTILAAYSSFLIALWHTYLHRYRTHQIKWRLWRSFLQQISTPNIMTSSIEVMHPSNKSILPAAIALWFHLRLPSCGRGFESQAHHLSFFNLYNWNCNEKRTKVNKKEAAYDFCKKLKSFAFLRAYFVFGKTLNFLWQILYAVVLIFIVVNGQILEIILLYGYNACSYAWTCTKLQSNFEAKINSKMLITFKKPIFCFASVGNLDFIGFLNKKSFIKSTNGWKQFLKRENHQREKMLG